MEAWVLEVLSDGVLLEQDGEVHELLGEVEHLIPLERPDLYGRDRIIPVELVRWPTTPLPVAVAAPVTA